MSHQQRRLVAMVMMSLTLVLGACAKSSTPVSSGENLSLVPFESLADWKSYGDLVAVVRIDSEAKRKDPQQSAGFENPPLRYVTATVERTLWSRTGDSPKQMEFLTDGWILRGGDLTPVKASDGPRLELGNRYLIGFMHTVTGMEAMTGSSMFSLDGDKLVAEQPQAFVNRPLDGLTVNQLNERLKATEPDPIAAKFADLPPRQRYEEVRKARDAAAGPTTTDH